MAKVQVQKMIEYEVDLSMFSLEDLQEEAKRRGYGFVAGVDALRPLEDVSHKDLEKEVEARGYEMTLPMLGILVREAKWEQLLDALVDEHGLPPEIASVAYSFFRQEWTLGQLLEFWKVSAPCLK